MAEKLRRRPMPATDEQRQFKIDHAGQVAFTPMEGRDAVHFDAAKNARSKRYNIALLPRLDIHQTIADALHREAQFNTQFLWCVICVATGSLIYFTAGKEILLQPVLFGLAAVLTIMQLASQRPLLKTLVIYAACIVTGILLGKMETLTQPTRMLGAEVTTTVSAQIVRFERLANGRKRLLLHVVETERPRLNFLAGQLRLTYRGETDFTPGDVIRGRARLFPPSGPVKPGGFDFSYQAYFSNLAATGIFFGAPEKLSINADQTRSFRLQTRIMIERTRQSIEERIKASLTGASGDLASALVTGRKSAIADDTNEALRATGLAHILSISGLHMVLAAGSMLFAVRFILALFPAFSMDHNARKTASVLALIIATLYLGISGASIATQRSYIMLAIILGALLCDRQALTMRNLAIAALLVLMVHPHEILNAGFHMSFAATAALIAAYGAVRQQRFDSKMFNNWMNPERFIGRIAKAIITFFGGLAMTALIAGFATGLYSIYHFERFAPYGILANVVAMPIVTALIMPSALLAMLLMPFDLDFYAWKAMGLGIDYVVAVADNIAAFTPDKGTGALPKGTIVAGTIALLLLTALRSKLAILAIIPIGFAIWSTETRHLPIGYVHESGKTVGILNDQGDLALNRNRVSTFVADQWQRSLMAGQLQNPAIKRDLPFADLIVQTKRKTKSEQFYCNTSICVFGDKNGIQIVTVKTYESLAQICHYFSQSTGKQKMLPMIVFEKIETPQICGSLHAHISNAHQRAYQGSFALFDTRANLTKLHPPAMSGGDVEIAPLEHTKRPTPDIAPTEKPTPTFKRVYSYQSIERPWHRHRAYSRAARRIETY